MVNNAPRYLVILTPRTPEVHELLPSLYPTEGTSNGKCYNYFQDHRMFLYNTPCSWTLHQHAPYRCYLSEKREVPVIRCLITVFPLHFHLH